MGHVLSLLILFLRRTSFTEAIAYDLVIIPCP